MAIVLSLELEFAISLSLFCLASCRCAENTVHRVLCGHGNGTAAEKAGMCVANKMGCANVNEKTRCLDNGLQWCGDTCKPTDERCPGVVPACKRGDYRCLDGACSPNHLTCKNHTSCGDDEKRCADGRCVTKGVVCTRHRGCESGQSVS